MCIRDRFKMVMEKIEESNRSMVESLKEDFQSLKEDLSKKLDEDLQLTIEENKKFREKLRREREQSNPKIDDNQMEVEEVHEDKNMEQVSPKPEESEKKKIQIIKETEEVKMEEKRTIRPKKTRVTKELIEMTRGGLINMINLPIVNHEEGPLSLIHI